MFCSNCGAPLVPGAAFCQECGAAAPQRPPVQQQPPAAATPKRRTRSKVPPGLGRGPERTMGRRILGFMYMGAQAWWHRFLLASGAGKLLWGLLPLMGACVFCSIVAAPFSDEDEPDTEARRTVTATVVQATRTTAATVTTAVPTDAPTTTVAAPTPASDAAALLPTTTPPAAEPAAAPPTTLPPTEPPAPSPTAGPPQGVAASAGNMRDQPTTAGSTVIGALTAGETVVLRRATPDGSWFAVETPGGVIGWVSGSLLTVAPEIAAQLPTGTTDEAIAVRPTAEVAQQPTAAQASGASSVVIVEVDKRAETVTLQNTGTQPVDLSRWRLLSVTGGQDHPIGGVLEPGVAREFPGPEGNIWNNSKSDPAHLIDPGGQVVDTYP